MCNQNELGLVGEVFKQFNEATDVGFIEHRVHFIQNAKRCRRNFKQCKNQGNRRQTALTAGEKHQPLFSLSGQTCFDFYSAVDGRVIVAEDQFGRATIKQT